MAQRVCLKHKMPDGTIMEGPTHGVGQTCVEYADNITGNYKTGGKIKNPRFKGKTKKTAVNFSVGGMLVGPSHENGGIPVIVDGTEPIEVEGGEFIINKQTVDSVGEDFLHKLNSTETTHHNGGFSEGQLPSPSQFKDGGNIPKRQGSRRIVKNKTSKRLRRGGRTKPLPTKKMAYGGQFKSKRKKVVEYKGGGKTITAHGLGRKILSKNNKKSFNSGGNVFGSTKSQCKLHGGKYGCNNTPGCRWNVQTDRCQ